MSAGAESTFPFLSISPFIHSNLHLSISSRRNPGVPLILDQEMPEPTMPATRVMPLATKAPKVTSMPASKPKEGWAFVNLSEPMQSKDKSLRKMVRSNAMRDYCRKNKKKTKRATKHKSELGDPTARHKVNGSSLPTLILDGDHGAFAISCSHAECVYGCKYSSSWVLSSPIQCLGDGGTDPFDASPMGGDLQYQGYILKHCELPKHLSLEHMCVSIYMHPLIQTW